MARHGRGDDTIAESLRYRPATNADCASVERLVVETLREYGLAPEPDGVDSDLRDLQAHYLDTGGWFGVWVDETGAIVGSAGLCPLGDTACELRKMYLRESARGRGHGKAILNVALAEARRRGFARVELETATVLKEAIRLYEKFGFRREPIGARCAKRCDIRMVLDMQTD